MNFQLVLDKREMFNTIAKYYTTTDWEDIVQELYVKLWEMHKRNDLARIFNGKAINIRYVIVAIKNLVNNRRSVKKRYLNIDTDEPYEDTFTELEIDICLKYCHPYYRLLLETYRDLGTIREVSKRTHISTTTITQDLQFIKSKFDETT